MKCINQAGGMNNEIKLLKNKANKILGEINKLVMVLLHILTFQTPIIFQ